MTKNGKNYTEQDFALMSAIMKQMPFQAMTGTQKQMMIDNKALLADLLAFTFTGDLDDVMSRYLSKKHEICIWRTEDPRDFVFEEIFDGKYDAVEVWKILQFKGLEPQIDYDVRLVATANNSRFSAGNVEVDRFGSKKTCEIRTPTFECGLEQMSRTTIGNLLRQEFAMMFFPLAQPTAWKAKFERQDEEIGDRVEVVIHMTEKSDEIMLIVG